jgi:HAD superfamily hydrolase (TIGR01459 family)
MTASIPTFPTLEVALNETAYSALFLDAFGVFWAGNAQGVFPGSQRTMEQLFSSGKKIGIISNSTHQSQSEIKKYASQGILQGRHFHFLITSGDLAKELFSSDRLPFPTPNKKYILFCPHCPPYAPPSSLFEESPFRETDDLLEADFIYINVPHICGVNQEERNAFHSMVKSFLPSNKPMVCANPDHYAHEGSPPRPVVRQGSIASLYEEMGGHVFYIGKPFSQIYSLALDRLNRLSPTPKEKILMVGDTPETDIRGARSFGIHSALITHTGIMAEKIAHQGPASIQSLPTSDIPNFFIERFASHVF